MSQTGTDFFANLPGFDFLKSLSSAQTASLNPWLKPTLDPKELDQRIQELKTVQFWLEQNAKALAATIQGLEVQRMTLSTLQQMNVDWKSALQPKKASGRSSASTSAADGAPSASASSANEAASSGAAPEALRLWTSLANQFGQIAQQSMTDMQRHAREAVSAVGERATQAAASVQSAKPVKPAKTAQSASGATAKTTRRRSRKA